MHAFVKQDKHERTRYLFGPANRIYVVGITAA